jgi:25S rRNA (adenine2142-N1)-methyltransferase
MEHGWSMDHGHGHGRHRIDSSTSYGSTKVSSPSIMTMTKKRSRRPQPLVPPPHAQALRSRKRARQVTTLFHKYTQERDAAVARAEEGVEEQGDSSNLTPLQIKLMDDVRKIDDKIAEIGGREEYQRASQMNTSMFSTSKWVLGILGRWGWLDGLPVGHKNSTRTHERKINKKEKPQRRDVRLLEVGAINTQLIDAAARTKTRTNNEIHDNTQKQVEGDGNKFQPNQTERVCRLDVKAIDIRSTDPRIQQLDFFELHLHQHHDPCMFYDVIVNSMVINCVTTPAQRGKMLLLCYKYLRPGGVCFLTLPKLCLLQSKFMSRSYFEEILTSGIGFEIMQEVGRDSPKIAFFVLRRPEEEVGECKKGTSRKILDDKFTLMPALNRGKQFRNAFALTLNDDDFDE